MARWTLRSTLLLLPFLGACSATMARGVGVIRPGGLVTADHVATFCPSPEHYQERLAFYEAEYARTKAPQVPRVGHDACEVLAAIGWPDRVDLVEVEGGGSASWWYDSGQSATYDRRSHVVELNKEGIVTAVVW